MSDTIDARGLSCPQPVILTQKAISIGKERFSVLVNSVVSMENVTRCVENSNMKCSVTTEGDDFIIEISK